MTPTMTAVLFHISECEARAVITGPKALATLATTRNTVPNATREDIRDLYAGGYFSAEGGPRTRSALRYKLTDKGRAILAERVMA